MVARASWASAFSPRSLRVLRSWVFLALSSWAGKRGQSAEDRLATFRENPALTDVKAAGTGEVLSPRAGWPAQRGGTDRRAASRSRQVAPAS